MQQILHESLAAFDLGCVLAGAEDAKALALQMVHNPCGQRIIRAYHDKPDLLLLGKSRLLVELEHADRHAFRNLRDPGIAGRAVNFVRSGALGQAPAYGMLPSAASDNQNIHGSLQPPVGSSV
ncbi:hypothetical protein D3C71_1329300 [compost metagenome]